MDEKALISTLQSKLESKISIPVKTGAIDDERPVPVVIIEDWNTNDMNHNNSAHAGSYHGDADGDGTKEYEWYLNFSFKTRVELLFRHHDEVKVSEIKSVAKSWFRILREHPDTFHEDLKKCVVSGDGSPTYTFVEPRESELMLSANFHGDHTVTRTAADVEESTLEQVKNDFTFNPN
jgi:hypothetical protein